MVRVADIISKSSYVLNPAILSQIKKVINTEIVIFDTNNKIVSATFSEPAIQEGRMDFFKTFLDRPYIGKEVKLGRISYRIIIHPIALPTQGQAFLSLWMPTEEADKLRTKIILGLGGITLLGIIAMAGMGYLIARGITSPVEKLVKVAEKVSDGDFSERARFKRGDEIGRLANAFNYMIDQLKIFENRLVVSEKLATAGQMAVGLAHEIRNPLTSIKMFGQVLYNRLKEQAENQKILNSLIKEIDRLDRIIQEIINRARPGELQRNWEDLNRHVEEVIQLAADNLSGHKIKIKRNLADDLPRIYLDPEKFKQVLWNLILNAKEAMPKGGELVISTALADNQFITLSVEDTGHGISTVEAEQFFQPFFTTKPEGMGLGLTMSRNIVQQHKGQLTLENRPDGGTKAIVLIPIIQDRPND